jgi:hypothetical protein
MLLPPLLLSLPHVLTQHMPAAVALCHGLLEGTAQSHKGAISFASYQCTPALTESLNSGEDCSHCDAGLCGDV